MAKQEDTKPSSVYTYKKILKFFLRLQHNIQLYHWNTQIYSVHKSTEDLYRELSSHIDKFIEVYMSYYGRPTQVLPTKNGISIKLKVMNAKLFITYMDRCHEYLTGMGQTSLKNKQDLINIRDDMLVTISQARYLLSMA